MYLQKCQGWWKTFLVTENLSHSSCCQCDLSSQPLKLFALQPSLLWTCCKSASRTRINRGSSIIVQPQIIQSNFMGGSVLHTYALCSALRVQSFFSCASASSVNSDPRLLLWKSFPCDHSRSSSVNPLAHIGQI